MLWSLSLFIGAVWFRSLSLFHRCPQIRSHIEDITTTTVRRGLLYDVTVIDNKLIKIWSTFLDAGVLKIQTIHGNANFIIIINSIIKIKNLDDHTMIIIMISHCLKVHTLLPTSSLSQQTIFTCGMLIPGTQVMNTSKFRGGPVKKIPCILPRIPMVI